MADEGVGAVAEAPVIDSVDASVDSTVDTSSTVDNKADSSVDQKIDGRRQPDALRKEIAELRRQADSITDPALKQAKLEAARELNNKVGKVAAYEQIFPTVRESREIKALVESFGGKEGLAQVQERLSNAQQIDQKLEGGDPSVIGPMWDEAPQGMVKLAPMIFSELEKRNPQEYQKAVVPHAVKFFDQSGFPEAFDRMVEAYKSGDKTNGDALSARLARWFSSQRQATAEAPRTDPQVEKLQKELEETRSKESAQATDRAYNEVISHAGPVIDKFLKPIVAKLGLSKDQYDALREDTWKHLQDTRNADQTYKTVVTAKYRDGLPAVTKYIQGETEARAQDAARARANFWYGHQLKNGAVAKPNPVASPVTPGITRGKEPLPSEIDYSTKGLQVAKKQGFKDLSDMILAGKAPLKAGGIRQWR